MKKINTRKGKAILLSIILLVLLFVPYSYAGTYYVAASGGGTSWADCTNISTPCTLATANTNAAAGDTVYLRGGTYEIKTNAIIPSNSGSAGNPITFSGYGSETVTIHGASDITGVSSRGIYLNGRNYIKVTKINFSNMSAGLHINNANHNEISYCSFSFRDPWADVFLSGTAKSESTTELYDNVNNLSSYSYRRIYNVTDKSSDGAGGVATLTTIPTTLVGAAWTDKHWDVGDSYQITSTYSYDPAAIDIGGNSTHNWIHHCTMHGYGALSYTGDLGVLFSIGTTTNQPAHELNSNNTVEYNHIYAGGHHVFAVNSGYYNVVRKNYIHHEGWFSDSKYDGFCASQDNGVCGYRVIYSCGSADYVGYTLYEGNAIAYGAQYGGPHPISGGSGAGLVLSNSNNIVRYNSMFGNAMYGLAFYSSLVGITEVGAGNDNRVYNNIFLSNGYNWSSYGVVHEDDTYLVDAWRTGITFGNPSGIAGNVIKNNLFHDSWTVTHKYTQSVYYPDIYAWSDTNLSNNIISNNYTKDNTYLKGFSPFADTNDPLFVAPDITTPLGETVWSNYTLLKPDLSLSVTSPAINQGTYLTSANGAGSSSITLVVADASYFQDGTWGSDLAMATLEADQIAIGTVGNVVRISSINYTTNTITLASPMNWNDGASIWLYKKSDGMQVLDGPAPDFGAHEYIFPPPVIVVTPVVQEFGSISPESKTPPEVFTVTTTGGYLEVDTITPTGTDSSQFIVLNDACSGQIVGPITGGNIATNCTFEAQFAPLTEGEKEANISITSNDPVTPVSNIAVSGTGDLTQPAYISLSPASISFLNVAENRTSTAQTVTITNIGGEALDISDISLSGTDSGLFKKVNDVCTGKSIGKGVSCTFGITFSPKSGGAKTATVTIASNAGNSPNTVALSGNGTSTTIVTSNNSTIPDYTVTNSIAGAPSGYTAQKVVSFNATDVVNTANFSITYPSLPPNPVFYKVNNGWKEIHPVNQTTGITGVTVDGLTISFTVADNSDGDSNPTVGAITDPVVVGTKAANNTRNPNPNTTGDIKSDSGGGCFIATAAYGSSLDPHIKVLRKFRDRYLLTNSLGRVFVSGYYRYSPPVAAFIEKHETVKTAARWTLAPVVYCVEYPLVFAAIVLIMPAGFVLVHRRRKAGESL
ncbi:MAG: choice-of-anchor D domain-containing protein [Desulfobacteraceae bacterium]|nr:MAG: choice-of-anchor D domain-containing protein [Desulfobacteraceae bacterium]